MGIVYRPEIDGLRAIAVLAVVLYHAGVGGAGFVGVDVFFVISGYLITALLLAESRGAGGGIDLVAFYGRRVRRIVPAATVVVLAVVAMSQVLLPASQQVHADQSAAASLLFVANHFFQFTSGGYFDPSAEEMPLLHMWTLSVEEQFYLVWPLLLVLAMRRGSPRPWVAIAGLGLLSFLFAEFLMASDPEAAFYLMPARFWELAAGGLVAAMSARRVPAWVLSLGLLVTLGACAWPVAHFPGLGAMPAVAGSALVLGAVHGGATNAFLRWKPMVGLGLVSYGLYLWHWPLLALHRATSIGEPGLGMRLALCAIAVLLSIATYRYVEQPIRLGRWRNGPTVAVGAFASLSLAVLAVGLGLQVRQQEGFVPDNPLARRAERDMPAGACRYLVTDVAFPKCPDPDGARTAIWGDSMAYAWRPYAESLGPTIDYSRDACDPLVGYLPDKVFPGDVKCRDFNAKVAARATSLDTVVLAAAWPDDASLDRLGATLDALRPVRRVVILGPTPRMRDVVPRCIRQDALGQCAVSRAEFDAWRRPLLARLRAISAGHSNVEIIDPADYFCTPTTCPPIRDGVPLYWDSHHVSTTAAAGFARSDSSSGVDPVR